MPSKSIAPKRNLLLCFDAFGTLFTPNTPIPIAYARAAARHGIDCGNTEEPKEVGSQFKKAFKEVSRENPNYGKATGLGAEKWWGNVIRQTFTSFLKPGQEVPPALIAELLERYSTREGYDLFPDVLPFFQRLRALRTQGQAAWPSWPFDETVVGIITNSDSRVPGILQSFDLKIGSRRIETTDQRINRANVDDDISFVVLSYDVGVEKPERKMFDAASIMLAETLAGSKQSLDVDDFEKLYVGDDLEKDYLGAGTAGWHALLLDRSKNLELSTDLGLGWTNMVAKDGNQKRVRVTRSITDLDKWRPGDGESERGT